MDKESREEWTWIHTCTQTEGNSRDGGGSQRNRTLGPRGKTPRVDEGAAAFTPYCNGPPEADGCSCCERINAQLNLPFEHLSNRRNAVGNQMNDEKRMNGNNKHSPCLPTDPLSHNQIPPYCAETC